MEWQWGQGTAAEGDKDGVMTGTVIGCWGGNGLSVATGMGTGCHSSHSSPLSALVTRVQQVPVVSPVLPALR